MLAEAPAFLIAIEQSAFAAAVRQSLWAYPAANVGHILALFLFAGAVSIMDLTLLGALRGAKPATIVLLSRNAAIGGLLLMMATGSVLFAAEASHVAMNPVFQIKAALIGFGYGAETSAAPYLISLFFGLRAFGEIYSYLFITVPLGGALGPALMGFGFDRAGSYQLALSLCIVGLLAAALLMLRLRLYPTFKE